MTSGSLDNARSPPTRRYVSLKEAAVYLGESEKGLRKLVERRQVPFRRNGRRLIFDLQELEAWFQSLPGVTLDEGLARSTSAEERLPPKRRRKT
jgi:excisionase family DNA binding protein